MTTAVEWADRSNAPGCARVINAAVSDEGEKKRPYGLAAALRAHRESKDQSTYAAAAEMGAPQPSYQNWEKGVIPRPENFDQIAAWLGITRAELKELIAQQRRLRRKKIDELDDKVTRIEGVMDAILAELAELKADRRRHRR